MREDLEGGEWLGLLTPPLFGLGMGREILDLGSIPTHTFSSLGMRTRAMMPDDKIGLERPVHDGWVRRVFWVSHPCS